MRQELVVRVTFLHRIGVETIVVYLQALSIAIYLERRERDLVVGGRI